MLHVAVYAGVPRANHALKIVKETLRGDGGGAMTRAGAFFHRDRDWHPPA